MKWAACFILSVITAMGCSRKEQVPKVSREEWAEVQSHFPFDGKNPESLIRFLRTEQGESIMSRRLLMLFSDRGIAVLRGATRVEASRIVDPEWHPEVRSRFGSIEGYPIIARGKDLGTATVAAKTADSLLDGKLYFISLDCLPDPGVALLFRSDKGSVTLIVCYECNQFDVYVRDGSGSLFQRLLAEHHRGTCRL